MSTTPIGCIFPVNPTDPSIDGFCLGKGFTLLPNDNKWSTSFSSGGNTGPGQFLITNEPTDVGYLLYTSQKNTDGLQTAYVSPILDVTTVGTMKVEFKHVLNGRDVGTLCKCSYLVSKK